MENLIDKRYFWGNIQITGLTKEESETELNKYIAKYQAKYIKDMFGTAFDEEIPETIKAKLFNDTLLTSPIANYVYYYWQRDKAVVQTNAGTKQLTTQNTISVSPANKICSAWNEMVVENIAIHDYLFELGTTDFDYLNDIYPYINNNVITHINEYNF